MQVLDQERIKSSKLERDIYDFERKANIKMGFVSSAIRRTFDTTTDLTDSRASNTDLVKYNGIKAQFQMDQLDSLSFPTRGYFLGARLEQGVSGAIYTDPRVQMLSVPIHLIRVLSILIHLC